MKTCEWTRLIGHSARSSKRSSRSTRCISCMEAISVTECYVFGRSFDDKWIACKHLTIIGRGWAKYCDLSVASRSIICRSRRLRQIIDLRDIDKSQYFAITEFDNCFIIRSPSLFLYLNHSLTAHPKRPAIFSPRAWLQLRMRRILFAANHI